MEISEKDLPRIQTTEPEKHSSWIYKPLTEIMLMPVIGALERYIVNELSKKHSKKVWNLPKLIIIEGIDGCGKTTLVNQIIDQLKPENCKFNRKTKHDGNDPFKFTRKDATEKGYDEYQFRLNVVKSINRRIEWIDGKEPYIIMDKSPYSEIYYQKTPSFTEYREKITQEQWRTIEQECKK